MAKARTPEGIDDADIIATVHARSAPMIPATTGLRPRFPSNPK
jgi:hypothetical protein